MAATKAGNASWGVTGACSGVSGIVTSIEKNVEAVLAPEYNEVGQVVKNTHYDTKTTLNATVEVASGTDVPSVGTAITICGVSGYVTSARLTEDNQTYRKIAVTAECYINCSATTAESLT